MVIVSISSVMLRNLDLVESDKRVDMQKPLSVVDVNTAYTGKEERSC